MKKLLILMMIPLLIISLWLPAAAKPALLHDEAGCLSAAEEARLETLLQEVSDRNEFAVSAVITERTDGSSPSYYAHYLYYSGYGRRRKNGGILLLICTASRDYYLQEDVQNQTLGEDGLQRLTDDIVPLLKKDDFAGAVEQLALTCDEVVTIVREEGSYTYVPALEWYFILLAIGIGLLLGCLVVFLFASKLRSVRKQAGARNYMDEGSLCITAQQDQFLYHTVTRIPRQQSNGSGGGGSSGGSGGKF